MSRLQKIPLSYRFLDGLAQSLGRLKGRALQRMIDAMTREAAAIFPGRADDIYVVSYPKSGTTLMQMMLYQLTSAGKMDFPHISAVAPWFEVALRYGGLRQVESLPSPRVFKSHLLAEDLKGLPGRFIYVARNVYDVAVSSYHHRCLVSGLDLDLDAYLDEFIAGEVTMFGSWFEHIHSWWPCQGRQNTFFLLFEEALADPEGTARRLAAFCELEVDESTIRRVVDRTSFPFMQRHNHLFDPRLHRVDSQPAPDLMATLAPGVGARTLSLPQQRKLDRRLGELDGALGYPRGAVA